SVSSLYNKLIVIPEHSNNSQNSGVRSYSLLLSLVNTQLPDYANTIILSFQSKLKSEKTTENQLYIDTYVNATKDENDQFVQKLIQTPFFEIVQKNE
ncbi:MAG: hypothetical protein V3V22_03310, partial [Methylococcales bacterium]